MGKLHSRFSPPLLFYGILRPEGPLKIHGGSSMQKIPITREGFDRLIRELEQLKKVDIPANIRDIEEARSHGDISENAEYAAAKERQSFLQGKLQELENNLSQTVIIDPRELTNDRAVFGSLVTLEDQVSSEVIAYRLVGPLESDLSKFQISITSPIGKALIGKRPGDEVTVKTPGGIRQFEVLDISL